MARKKPSWWKEKLDRSSFFLLAVFLHLIILAMVATLVIFQPVVLTSPDFTKAYVPPGAPPPPPPPQTEQQMSAKIPTVTVPVTAPAIVSPNAAIKFTIPTPDLNVVVDTKAQTQEKPTNVTVPGNGLSGRLPGIMNTELTWRSRDNILNSDGDVHNVVAKFPVYLAKYADGDWSCNNYPQSWDANGVISSGCLANLVFQVGIWSRGNLTGDVVRSIAIDSPDLLNKPPPFIYFTGHKDFHLTDPEIENLRKYLQVGGCIWGDSAFAGDGSRFDVAFHREMKRVLPDADKNFEVLPMSHDIFTHSWFTIDKMPPGMNYRADPAEIINIDGKLAVIYTPNDYSDMMTMLLKQGTDPPVEDPGLHPATQAHPLYTEYGFSYRKKIFYRNYEPESVEDCYKLSMNILCHLLVRFDKDLELAP